MAVRTLAWFALDYLFLRAWLLVAIPAMLVAIPSSFLEARHYIAAAGLEVALIAVLASRKDGISTILSNGTVAAAIAYAGIACIILVVVTVMAWTTAFRWALVVAWAWLAGIVIVFVRRTRMRRLNRTGM